MFSHTHSVALRWHFPKTSGSRSPVNHDVLGTRKKTCVFRAFLQRLGSDVIRRDGDPIRTLRERGDLGGQCALSKSRLGVH